MAGFGKLQLLAPWTTLAAHCVIPSSYACGKSSVDNFPIASQVPGNISCHVHGKRGPPLCWPHSHTALGLLPRRPARIPAELSALRRHYDAFDASETQEKAKGNLRFTKRRAVRSTARNRAVGEPSCRAQVALSPTRRSREGRPSVAAQRGGERRADEPLAPSAVARCQCAIAALEVSRRPAYAPTVYTYPADERLVGKEGDTASYTRREVAKCLRVHSGAKYPLAAGEDAAVRREIRVITRRFMLREVRNDPFPRRRIA
ncbi:hypothetical protein GQ600_3009 [Phytophthora cactorum]|nr:hypothetical protein GQ600_3009 [Phytophthora cactorum]